MKKLNFLLIGCGRISKNHVAAAAENAGLMELVAVCDLIEERAEEKAASLQEKTGKRPAVYTDYKKALEELEIDCCSIATESGYHAEIALDCLRRGKHVLVEKPMALSTHDAQLMIQEANSRGLKLGVCHQNRFNAPIQELHRAIEDNRFGKLVNGTARILWNRSMPYYEQAPWRGTWEQDGGTLMNQCIHNIDLLHLGGYSKKEKDMDQRALEILSVFGLDSSANDLASNLPYGKQRKLEISRALATSPKLLLLDEPAAGMNPNETGELMETISLVRKKYGVTILLIEHDMKLVQGICEYLYVLNFGKLLAEGTPAQVLNDPAVIKAYLGD